MPALLHDLLHVPHVPNVYPARVHHSYFHAAHSSGLDIAVDVPGVPKRPSFSLSRRPCQALRCVALLPWAIRPSLREPPCGACRGLAERCSTSPHPTIRFRLQISGRRCRHCSTRQREIKGHECRPQPVPIHVQRRPFGWASSRNPFYRTSTQRPACDERADSWLELHFLVTASIHPANLALHGRGIH